jgi:hypothetical protein
MKLLCCLQRGAAGNRGYVNYNSGSDDWPRVDIPGAILATVLWWLAATSFGWYVRNIANYNVLYGSVGAVIALLVYMYLLSIIAFVRVRDQRATGPASWRPRVNNTVALGQ